MTTKQRHRLRVIAKHAKLSKVESMTDDDVLGWLLARTSSPGATSRYSPEQMALLRARAERLNIPGARAKTTEELRRWAISAGVEQATQKSDEELRSIAAAQGVPGARAMSNDELLRLMDLRDTTPAQQLDKIRALAIGAGVQQVQAMSDTQLWVWFGDLLLSDVELVDRIIQIIGEGNEVNRAIVLSREELIDLNARATPPDQERARLLGMTGMGRAVLAGETTRAAESPIVTYSPEARKLLEQSPLGRAVLNRADSAQKPKSR